MKCFNLFVLSLCFAGSVFANDLQKFGGKTTKYSKIIEEQANGRKSIDQKTFKLDENGIGLTCFKDPQDDLYIGVAQHMEISASLEKVTSYFDRFDDYKNWFDGLVNIKSSKLDNQILLVKLEQAVPIVSNVMIDMLYRVEKSPTHSLYFYQLKQSNTMTAYDGYVLLEKINEKTVRFTEVDFMNADWGAARIFGSNKIWSDSLKGFYQSDLAMKMRIENSTVSDQDVMQTSISKAKARDFDDCIDHKMPILNDQLSH